VSQVSDVWQTLAATLPNGIKAIIELYDYTNYYKAGYHIPRYIKGQLLELGCDPDTAKPDWFSSFIEKAADELDLEDTEIELIVGTYLKAFPLTTTPEGYDKLSEAMRTAEKIQLPSLAPINLRPTTLLVAKLAYTLSLDNPDSFVLPQHRIAQWLKISQPTVSAMLTILETRGVIKCTDNTYSLSAHKAKEYRFIYSPKK
jgi:hypothetical protein